MVESEYIGKGTSFSNDTFNGLASSMYIYIGVKVVLTKNYLQVSLSNGLIGIVWELIYDTDKPAPSLPKLVFINFGAEYIGNLFFPNDETRKGWFLIYLVTNKYYTINRRGSNSYTENSRTILPLKLC